MYSTFVHLFPKNFESPLSIYCCGSLITLAIGRPGLKASNKQILASHIQCARYLVCSCVHGVEKSMKYEKNAWVFLTRYTIAITKMLIWKYSMCILAKNIHFPNLCTKKGHKFAPKMAIFSIKMMIVEVFGYEVQNKMRYSSYSDSIDMFRHRNFENR